MAKIQAACEAIRVDRGLDAVCPYRPLPPAGITQDQVLAELASLTVLAFDHENLDLTDAVLRKLES